MVRRCTQICHTASRTFQAWGAPSRPTVRKGRVGRVERRAGWGHKGLSYLQIFQLEGPQLYQPA